VVYVSAGGALRFGELGVIGGLSTTSALFAATLPSLGGAWYRSAVFEPQATKIMDTRDPASMEVVFMRAGSPFLSRKGRGAHYLLVQTTIILPKHKMPATIILSSG
jgi:hypothetical protein